jgi:hypothetical protein
VTEFDFPDFPAFPVPSPSPPAISPLATTGKDDHPLAAGCPLACLAGLLSRPALNRVLAGARQPKASTIADLAGLHQARALGEIPGIGPGRTAEIEALLHAAGLITSTDCYLAAQASELARQRRNWLAVIDGPVIGYLRETAGLPQSAVARRTGLSVLAVARAETEPASYCHRRTLARLASALGVPPGGLEHPAHQRW